MIDFLKNLPVPRNSSSSLVSVDASLAAYSLVPSGSAAAPSTHPLPRSIPPYGSRGGKWLPRCLDDFGDGGAYPEIPVAQFPLDMGRASSSAGHVVPLQMGDDGKLNYDSVIRQGLAHRTAIYTRPDDARAKWSAASELQKPEDEEKTITRTKAALETALARKIGNQPVSKQPEFIKYTSNQQAPGHNANCSQRLVRMVTAQVDPMEPPKHRFRRVPAGPSSPPAAILHSPPRKLTAKDQEDWKIPPCVSNWKNQKGYTIPLDKRLAADGRSLQDVTINDKFAGLSEALYIAERSAREQIRTRNELLKQKKQHEEGAREQQLRDLAQKARAERATVVAADPEQRQRQQVEREQRRKVERDLRLERVGKKSTRDEDRDISERIALGQAKPTSQEALFDSRLYNQTSGMDSGYGGNDDEHCSIYDKPLFADRSKQSLYRIDTERIGQNVGALDKVAAFAGAEDSAGMRRTAPVEFERDADDPFGLECLMEASKKKQKRE